MPMNSINSEFQQILLAAKERRGDLSVDSMIVSSHLAQMRTFMLRRGIEFYAEQDSFGKRRDFVAKLCEENMLEMKFESIVDYFLCDGQGLFYFRPAGESYQILYFPKDSYRAYRDQAGDLESLVLVYSFNIQQSTGLGDNLPGANGANGKKKWIQLKVYKDRIEQTISDEKIEFSNQMGAMPFKMPGQTEVLTNSLGFIPAVEVFNHMDCTGEATGNGEFDWLAHQILYHDELVRNIRKNMKFFGNPTLISSRPRHDILDSGDDNSFRPTISSQAGFAPIGGTGRASTRVSQPFGSGTLDGQIKVPRVIANLEPTDRVGYMTPDSVSGDQNLYVKQYRSEIRLALGGVDDIDINTAATAYEIKTLYGRVAATAEKKARALFTYGLCPLFSMMIYAEERNFNDSFAAAMKLEEPLLPLPEEFEDKQEYEKAYGKYQDNYQKFINKRDNEMRAKLDAGEIPPGVTGLVPDGASKVSWRWMGEVFEESTEDLLNNSIVVRNLQELGVDSIEALKYLFPGKTDEERAAMLSGFPFRMVQQTQQSISSFINLLGQFYQLPHPQMPDVPLASDPNLDMTGFLYRSLEFLRKELSYSGSYKPASTSSIPDELSSADQLRAERGSQYATNQYPTSPASMGQPVAPQAPAYQASAPAPQPSAPTQGNPWQQAFPGAQRKPEYVQPLPGPGFTLGIPDNADASGNYSTQLGFNGPTGSADFAAPSFNPELYGIRRQQPGAASGAARSKSGSGSVPKRNQRRKS
jgi:hypothetical protein